MKRLLAALVCSSALIAGATHAASVTPLSYVAPVGEVGSYTYFDDTGRQLIDGIFGGNNWAADLGNGNAQEWVGWRTRSPVITFNFGSTVNLTGIVLGMNRAEGAGIYTALNGSANGRPFAVGPNAFPNDTRADLTFIFAQPIVASSVTVSLDDRNAGLWLFFDEIQFLGDPGTTVVPVPGALALMLPGLALIAAAARRRRSADVV